MIRDGVDSMPAIRCGMHCGLCTRYCSKSLADWELRAQGWRPIAEAPLDEEIEGLTTNGNRLLIHYHSAGDYIDRWVGPARHGVLLDVTHWRPLRGPKLILIGPLPNPPS